jgi:hypothetical protein
MDYLKELKDLSQISFPLYAILNLIIYYIDGDFNIVATLATGIFAFLFLACLMLEKLFEKIIKIPFIF